MLTFLTWMWLPIPILVLILAVAVGYVWGKLEWKCYVREHRSSRTLHARHRRYGRATVLLALLTVVAAILGIGQAANFGSAPKVTYNQILASQFGFQSGKTYPLIIGARTGGSSGSVYGAFSFGFGSVSGSTVPSSSFPFSFTNDQGNSYMLDMPTSKTTFIKVADTSDESLVLNLTDADTDRLQACTQYRYHSGIFVRAKYVNCTMPKPAEVITEQFGDYVQDSVSSVVVHITDADYQKLLGN